jgi:glyoxylase-like metal-dependent hydrolase (beta-lactamase superfamily II)
MGYCNNVVIEMKNYLIVVDANYPGRAKELVEEVKQLSPKPVRYVFDTHAHPDHSYGNAVWTAAGATTLAFPGVVEEMNLYEPGRWQYAAGKREDVRELHRDTAQRPQQILKGSLFVLRDSTREVQFHYLGWGHTRGDGYVWLPRERILSTGDGAVNGPKNKIVDAWIANWPKVLERALRFKPLYVLPGHGPAGGPEILTGQIDFLEDLYTAVKQQADSGETPGQMHLELPVRDSNWVPVGALFAEDITSTYSEIMGHKPAGALPHGW